MLLCYTLLSQNNFISNLMEAKNGKSNNNVIYAIVGVVAVVVLGAYFMYGRTPEGEEKKGIFNKVADSVTGTKEIKTKEDWMKAMKDGDSVYCTMSITEGGMSMEAKMWMKGDSYKSEISANGSTTVVIEKDDKSYMQSPGTSSGCDWMVTSNNYGEDSGYDVDEEESEPGDYEEGDTAFEFNKNMKCQTMKISNSTFNTPGKVCDLSKPSY